MEGTVWKHTKSGRHYVVVVVAKREADCEPAVVYKSVDDGGVWVRPLAEWHQIVPVDDKTGRCAPRFQLIDDE